ncbi:MAG: PspA/IM30 family protein [Myxococcota bacterium]
MGIFRRLNSVLRSHLGAVLDRAEDPQKLIAQTVRDMEGELRKARQELVTAVGTARRLHRKREELEAEARQWEDKAVLALREGDEVLAREALRRKARTLREVEEVRAQGMRQEAAADEMKSVLDRIERRIGELKARGSTIAAEVRRAREAEPAGGSRYGSEAFDELERMGSRVDQLEAEVEASKVLDDGRRAELDARFRELEQGTEGDAVEDELASLKRKLDGGS